MGYVIKCQYCGYVYEHGNKYIKYRKKYKMCLCDECVDKANWQWMPNSGLDTYPEQVIFIK